MVSNRLNKVQTKKQYNLLSIVQIIEMAKWVVIRETIKSGSDLEKCLLRFIIILIG